MHIVKILSLAINLQDKAELFSASVRLQSVATGLQRIIDRQQMEERATENFKWMGNLVGQMDWDSQHYHQREHPELCLIATKLRPRFYEALLRFRIPFDAKFSEGIYETLKSYGGKVQLEVEELRQAHQIFESMATDILTELQYAYSRQ